MSNIGIGQATKGLTLRKRTLVAISLTLLGMMGLLFIFSQTIVKDGFESVENRDALLNVGRVRDAFDMQIETIAVKIIDWSVWDDAYKYMENGNEAFEKSSLAVSALLGMKFELFVWRHPDGRIQWGRSFNIEAATAEPLKPETIEFFNKNPDLFTYKNEEDRKGGIFDVPGFGPMFFAVQPIVTSEGKGPIVGSLIAARAINASMIERLKKLTHLELKLLTPAEIATDSGFLEASQTLKNPKDTFIKSYSEEMISGFTQFTDFFGNKVAFVRMMTPRDIHAQGKSTMWSFVLALTFAGLGFGCVIAFMLERSVISRVVELAASINQIRSKSDMKLRVPVNGKDEITSLAIATNEMLESIKASQEVIAKRNADMRLILDNAEEGFLTVSLDGNIGSEYSAIVEKWFGKPTVETKIWNLLMIGEPRRLDFFAGGWSQLVDDFLPFEVSAGQMPKLVQNGNTYYGLTFSPIIDSNKKLASVLVVVMNVTAKIEAERRDRQQQELVATFQALSKDRAGFLEYFADGENIVRVISDQSTNLSKDLQFRHIHTLKGNSAQYGLASVAEVCHTMESKLQDQEVPLGRDDINMIASAWNETSARLINLIGSRIRKSIELDVTEYASVLQSIKDGAPHGEIASQVERWRLEPASKRLERIAEQAHSLADRLNFPKINVVLKDNGVRLEPELFSEVWSSMVHVVRNAVDHGFGGLTSRTPQLTLETEMGNGYLKIRIKDNGAGIVWERVREKAKSMNLPHATQKDLENALFADGLSTKDTVTAVSGRGVGMAAVRAAVLECGGSIDISSNIDQGTEFVFSLPIARLVNSDRGVASAA